MTVSSPTELSWPNRGNDLIITASIMAIFCTLIAGWRLAVQFRNSLWLSVSDWLMLAGVVRPSHPLTPPAPSLSPGRPNNVKILNFLSCVPFAVLSANSGQGRLMQDPWWLEPGRTSNELRYIFITQCLNVYAMFLVKASICAYLMTLGFGRSYRVFIWVSVVIVVSCNFIMMLVLHFASCRPLYSRWDASVDGKCWPKVAGETVAYVLIASNIFTNLASYFCHVLLKSGNLILVRSLLLRQLFTLDTCNSVNRPNGVQELFSSLRWCKHARCFLLLLIHLSSLPPTGNSGSPLQRYP